MGTWGTGLYSGDFAADLRNIIAAVVRLPFESDRLVEILCETEPSVANNPEDPEHSIFWFVVADQFSKRNIVSDRVRETALKLIDSGRDILAHENLGMSSSDLVKRKKTLTELRAKLVSPPAASTPRKTLKEPQPLLMEAGDLLIYPTCQGQNVNPYFKDNELSDSGWNADGWGALLVIDCGLAFNFLAWYRPLTIVESLTEKPSIDHLLSQVAWVQRSSGTCSSNHFKRMQLEKIHHFAFDEDRRRQCFPKLTSGINAAVQDISISNELGIGPYYNAFFTMRLQPDGNFVKDPFPMIGNLAAIIASQ